MIAVVVGGYGVYSAIGWFRESHAADIAQQSMTSAADTALAQTAPTILDGSAPMLRPDGTTAGILYRRGTSEFCEYNAVLTLGALPEGAVYEVWAVKRGLADVASRTVAVPRADGTFSVTFSQQEPLEYSTIVIMLEPNDGISTPSGIIAAQGSL
jgi:hypothetical protein